MGAGAGTGRGERHWRWRYYLAAACCHGAVVRPLELLEPVAAGAGGALAGEHRRGAWPTNPSSRRWRCCGEPMARCGCAARLIASQIGLQRPPIKAPAAIVFDIIHAPGARPSSAILQTDSPRAQAQRGAASRRRTAAHLAVAALADDEFDQLSGGCSGTRIRRVARTQGGQRLQAVHARARAGWGRRSA